MSKDYPTEIYYYGQCFKSSDFISLKPQFINERKAMRLLQQRHEACDYISKNEQKHYEITPTESNVITLETSNCLSEDEFDEFDDEYNFVLTCEDPPRLLIDKALNHSFLANGKKVLAAGGLMFNQGQLIGITNNSGHYRPTDEQMLAVIKALYLASDNRLRSYKSYVTMPTKTYVVQELVTLDDFSQASPLDESEILLLNGKRRVISGYDTNSSPKEQEAERRFGLQLAPELSEKYKNTLALHSFFKVEGEENDNWVSSKHNSLL